MSHEKLVFKRLRGMIHHDVDGQTHLAVLTEGDEIPEGADKAELARLKRLDAVGTEKEIAAEQAKRDAALNASPEQPAEVPARREQVDLARLGDYSEGELARLWAESPPKVSDIVAAVGDDKTLAARALAAERTASSGDPRKSLVERLEKIEQPSDDSKGQ